LFVIGPSGKLLFQFAFGDIPVSYEFLDAHNRINPWSFFLGAIGSLFATAMPRTRPGFQGGIGGISGGLGGCHLHTATRTICRLHVRAEGTCAKCLIFSGTGCRHGMSLERGAKESHSCSSGRELRTRIQLNNQHDQIMKRDIGTTATETTADIAQLAEDARTLLAATAQVAEQKVVEARKRVTNALEQGWDVISER